MCYLLRCALKGERSNESGGSFLVSFDDCILTDGDGFVRRADAGWYNTAVLSQIIVSWDGPTPDTVRFFFTPTGTEVMDQEELLQTIAPLDGENSVTLSASVLRRQNLMGHLTVVLGYGNETRQTDPWNVFYDEEAVVRYRREKAALEAVRTYLDASQTAYADLDLWEETAEGYLAAVWTVSPVQDAPDLLLTVRETAGGWTVETS